MYKHILVALDGSQTSDLALKEAMTLAKENKSVVKAINVIDAYHVSPATDFVSIKEVVDSLSNEGLKILANAKKRMDAEEILSETDVIQTNQASQSIAQVISNAAENWPADLIIVGTHGRKGFSHLLLGSVAESICRIATKPILLIRSHHPTSP